MQLVTARVNLRTHVESIKSLGAYFEAEGLEPSKGQGPLAVDLIMDRGKLGPKSHVFYQTDNIQLKGRGFGVGTDWQLDFDAAGSKEGLPIVRSTSKLTYVSLSKGMRAFTVQLQGHHEEAQLDTIQLSKATDLQHASVRMPKIVSTDLRDLPVVFGDSFPLKTSGELHASLSLDMDHEYWARGPLNATIDQLHTDGSGVRAEGKVKLQTQLRFNPKRKVSLLESTVFTLRDVNVHAGSRDVTGWWMNLTSPRFTVWSEPPAFDGTFSMWTRDLDPVLKTLAEKDVISDLIPLFTSLNNFRATARVRGAGAMTDVTIDSESQIWDAAGRFFKNGDKTQMAIVVGGQAVSLGIASKGDGLELMPFAKTAWLNDHLRDFPKPVLVLPAARP